MHGRTILRLASLCLHPFIAQKRFLFLARIALCCAADMRSDVQEIFKLTPHNKQVMMFSATLDKDMRAVCKKFMNEVRRAARAGPWPARACYGPNPRFWSQQQRLRRRQRRACAGHIPGATAS
jgi:hypothetical protein